MRQSALLTVSLRVAVPSSARAAMSAPSSMSTRCFVICGRLCTEGSRLPEPVRCSTPNALSPLRRRSGATAEDRRRAACGGRVGRGGRPVDARRVGRRRHAPRPHRAPGTLQLMAGLTYDTGALIAAERGDQAIWGLHRPALQRGNAPTVPAGVLAQAWRGRPQPNMSRLVGGCRSRPDRVARPSIGCGAGSVALVGCRRRFGGGSWCCSLRCHPHERRERPGSDRRRAGDRPEFVAI